MKSEIKDNNYVIKTVANALDLLELFQESNSELGITDLSKKLQLHKNNVFRLITTLNSRNYIEKNNASGKYRLGVKTRALGHLAHRQADYRQYIRPALLRLNQFSRETCYFSVISGNYSYYMDAVDSNLPVRLTQWLGICRSLHSSASGKVQLAFMPKEEQERILNTLDFVEYTDRTINNVGKLKIEFNKILYSGYAVENQEYDINISEIAAPILDNSGNVIGALSIAAPSMRINIARIIEELAPALCEEARSLSVKMCDFNPCN